MEMKNKMMLKMTNRTMNKKSMKKRRSRTKPRKNDQVIAIRKYNPNENVNEENHPKEVTALDTDEKIQSVSVMVATIDVVVIFSIILFFISNAS